VTLTQLKLIELLCGIQGVPGVFFVVENHISTWFMVLLGCSEFLLSITGQSQQNLYKILPKALLHCKSVGFFFPTRFIIDKTKGKKKDYSLEM